MSLLGRTLQPVVNAIWKANRSLSRGSHYGNNPHLTQSRSFYSGNVDRLLDGWTVQTASIDQYLYRELTSLRSRSRELVRQVSYGKKFTNLMKTNIIGPNGITVQSQLKRSSGEMDKLANDAVEAAYKLWSENPEFCDMEGRKGINDMDNLAVKTLAEDGEVLFEIFEGMRYGPHGIKLKLIDPELLDTMKNEQARNGNVIRLGVEYNSDGQRVRYYFQTIDEYGNYVRDRHKVVNASHIVHVFLDEYPNQSRGIPWMHAALQDLKSLNKYDESAMTAARYGAAKMVVLSSDGTEADEYEGDEEGYADNVTLDNIEPGTIKDIGTKQLHSFDPDYPHEMYESFVKRCLHSISTGIQVSYASLSNDLKDVNFSSIRTGVLEDRELYKMLQAVYIRQVKSVVTKRWLAMAMMKGAIRIGNRPLGRPYEDYATALHYQPRRWSWVDPQKDMNANKVAIDYRLKSRSQIMREQGDDPDTIWAEIAREKKLLEELGIEPVTQTEGEPDGQEESKPDQDE